MSSSQENSDNKKWQATVRSPSSSGSSKGKRIFVLAAILSALAAAVAVLLLLPNTGELPAVLTLSIREYKDDIWPTNPFAVQDGDLIISQFPKDKSKSAYNSQTKGRLLRELEDLPNDSESPIVVHLCAHAVVRNNEIFIIPGDASPDQTGGWVQLNSVLDILAKNANRQKLLILDIARLQPNVKLGILYQDAATQIDAILQKRVKKDKLPFFVLTACGNDQLSNVAGHLQQSAFAFFITRGLQGGADGWIDSRKNDAITVKELAGYVGKQVDNWAGKCRGVRQTPTLYGDGNDFTLARIDPDKSIKQPPKSKTRSYPAWLESAWKNRDRWREAAFPFYAPRPFRLYESLLLQSEQRWHGGIEPKRVHEAFKRESRVIEERIRDALDSKKYRYHSVALTRGAKKLPACEIAKNPKPAPYQKEPPKTNKDKVDPQKPKSKKGESIDADAEFGALVEKFKSGALDFSDPKKKLIAVKECAAFWKATASLPDSEVIDIISNYAASPLPLTQKRVQFVFELLRARKSSRKYAEIIVFERLDRWRKKSVDIGWPWSDDMARSAVRMTLQAEDLFAKLRSVPHALPWVRDALNQAETSRRIGEEWLFSGRPARPQMAAPHLAKAQQQYTRVEGMMATIREAFADHSRAMLELPSYASVFIETYDPSLDEKDAWVNAVRNTLTLHDLLKQQSAADLTRIDETHKTLRQGLNRLAFLFQERCREPFDANRQTAAMFIERQALLQSSLPNAADRLKLRALSQQTDVKLHRRALADEQSITKDTATASASSATASELLQKEWDQAYRRAWYHAQLLKLGGLEIEKLQKQLGEIKSSRATEKWYSFAAQLADAWNTQLPKRYSDSKSQPFESIRLSYLFSWYNSRGEWDNESAHWTHNPAAAYHQQARRTFWSLMADRCRRDHQTSEKWPGGGEFFAEAAAEYSR